jgi:hypothetical protein
MDDATRVAAVIAVAAMIGAAILLPSRASAVAPESISDATETTGATAEPAVSRG